MEREDNSVVEVKRILVQSLLHEHKMNNFMPLKVKSMLAQKQKDGYGQRCDHFSAQSCSRWYRFVFAIPAHNANVERIFSLMQAQWTKERNRMSVDSLKGILCTQYNFRNMTCKDFHTYIMVNRKLLKEMQSSDKYEEEEQEDG
ncbi:hypothetical protein SRHO_G00002050 [Serrasalmus rhombeus]